MLMRVAFCFSVFTSLILTTTAHTQTCRCSKYTFPNKEVFATCRDLPHSPSFLHWTYQPATGNLDIAFRHSGIENPTNTWVAWAINPNNNLIQAMPGAQALVAIPAQSCGAVMRGYTCSISSYNTVLEESNISYPYSNLMVTFQNNEVTIFATLTLPKCTTSLVHLWQSGSVSDSVPEVHDMASANLNSKEILHLVSPPT